MGKIVKQNSVRIRKIWRSICCAAAALLLAGCSSAKPVPAIQTQHSDGRPISILVATDLHYLSPRLTDGGELYQQVVVSADGRTMAYIEELTDAFVAEVIDAAPDALILSGDLTFNGAYTSHMDLIDKLELIRDAGIQVLVLPGNHDLDNPYAASFSGDSHEPQRSLTAEEFRAEYADFGYAQAMSLDPQSGSYLCALRDDLWLLMLDANSGGYHTVPKETLQWVEQQLKLATARQAKVIAVSHQNLLAHNPRFEFGVRIGCGEELTALYEKYGVLCNLSGHMHMQHILTEPVPEAATSALPLWPNQYGTLHYENGTLSYQTKQLDVSTWAKNNGIDNHDLLHFSEYAHDVMMQAGQRKIMKNLSDINLTDEEKMLLADTFAALNGAYFAGDAIDPQEFSEGLNLWEAQSSPFFETYILSILNDAETEHHSLTLSAD